jgi:hypothetical protein
MQRIDSAVQSIAQDQVSVAETLNTLIQETSGSILETRVVKFGANQFLCILVVESATYIEWCHIALVDTCERTVEFFRTLSSALPLVEALVKSVAKEVTTEVLTLSQPAPDIKVTKTVSDVMALVDPTVEIAIEVGRTPSDIIQIVEDFARRIETGRDFSDAATLVDKVEVTLKPGT